MADFLFNKVSCLLKNFIKKETQAQVFSCELCEIYMNTFFTEHLWMTASEIYNRIKLIIMAMKSDFHGFSYT